MLARRRRGSGIARLAELALALTIPKEPTEQNDGFLTASNPPRA
jgi:hypothetical protein